MNAHFARLARLALLALPLALLACDDDPFSTRCPQYDACLCPAPPCAVTTATQSAATPVVPGATMPPQVTSQPAHNNLDIAWHQGRLYFAFRTAPNHFASPDTVLYVVSTTDHVEWRYEGTFAEGRDLREPRFLAIADRLFLFYARLGTRSVDFEPGGATMVEYNGPDDWSEHRTPEQLGLPPGFIPWRIDHVDGVARMTGYTGGEDIYGSADSDLAVYWLESRDGLTWAPVIPGEPIILRGGVSETDIAHLPGGDIVLVARNEAGDLDPETGEPRFGSRICRGSSTTLAGWRCVDDPRKYDSPLVWRHRDTVWLIGRRHLTETGAYDLGADGALATLRLRYLVDYWVHPKRCALWSIDPDTLAVTHVMDLPTAGDTCFASAVPLDADQYLVYDYRSPLDDPDIDWMRAQTKETGIYRLTLALP